MIVQPVISENNGQEGFWIAFLCALILLIGLWLLPYNSVEHEHASLASYQIEVDSLTPEPLAMIAELRLAHEEIYYAYETNQTWLSVVELEESWIAPFVKDKSGTYQGEHQWSLIAAGVYQSIPAKGGARYLLNNQQGFADIWVDLEQTATLYPLLDGSIGELPLLNEVQLSDAGWVQVVSAESEATHHH